MGDVFAFQGFLVILRIQAAGRAMLLDFVGLWDGDGSCGGAG